MRDDVLDGIRVSADLRVLTLGWSGGRELKAEAPADFMPFAEFPPVRGFAEKFDGVPTNPLGWHGLGRPQPVPRSLHFPPCCYSAFA